MIQLYRGDATVVAGIPRHRRGRSRIVTRHVDPEAANTKCIEAFDHRATYPSRCNECLGGVR
jgi:hypothetical protein